MYIQVNQLPGPIEKIVTDFVVQLDYVQPGGLKGLYLTGSIPLGDYYSKKSDIDFLAILQEPPSAALLLQFKKIHRRIEEKYNNPKLNGYYITLPGLKAPQPKFPSFFAGSMQPEWPFELDKFALFELQTNSFAIIGRPAAELPIQITMPEVLLQLHQNINSYWTSWMHRHSNFKTGHLYLSLFPTLTEWGILGVARQLYTLDMEAVTSKLHAGLYCMDKLPGAYHDIIRTAIETRKMNKIQLRPSLKRANKTIDCMGFIIDRFNKDFTEKSFNS